MSNPSVNQTINRYQQIACRFTLILVVSKPRHAHRDAQLDSLRVLSAITTMFGSAMPWRRAARFGVSPMMPRSNEGHLPTPLSAAEGNLIMK